ncbi:MAG: hypothetical protein IPI67_12640 [Myxococcales bacterium]|nr:hypothetical protein [Myxococcales bacterium]
MRASAGSKRRWGLGARLRDGYEVTLVDRSDSFFIGFSKIDVLFGRRTEAEERYPYTTLRGEGLRFVRATVRNIDTDTRSVDTTGGSRARSGARPGQDERFRREQYMVDAGGVWMVAERLPD